MERTREYIRRMTTAQNRIDGIYYLAAKALGTKDNTLALLYALDDDQPHTQKQICQEWLIPKSTLNTVVRECVAAGYMQLEPHAREKTIQLTPSGREYAAKLLRPLYAAEEAAMEEIPPEFVEALERFSHRFKAECQRFILQGEEHENQDPTV